MIRGSGKEQSAGLKLNKPKCELCVGETACLGELMRWGMCVGKSL